MYQYVSVKSSVKFSLPVFTFYGRLSAPNVYAVRQDRNSISNLLRSQNNAKGSSVLLPTVRLCRQCKSVSALCSHWPLRQPATSPLPCPDTVCPMAGCTAQSDRTVPAQRQGLVCKCLRSNLRAKHCEQYKMPKEQGLICLSEDICCLWPCQYVSVTFSNYQFYFQ